MNSVNLKSPNEDLIDRDNSQTDKLSNLLRQVKCENSDSFASESSEYLGPKPTPLQKLKLVRNSPDLNPN
jgi:hypothetical protein